MNKDSYILGYHFDRLNLPHKSKFLTHSSYLGLSDSFLIDVPLELPAYSIIEDFYLLISGHAKTHGTLKFGLHLALGTLPSDFNDMLCLAHGLYNRENKPELINLPDPFLLDLHGVNNYIGPDPLFIHFLLDFDTEVYISFDMRLKYTVPEAHFLASLDKLSAAKE